MAGRDTGFSSRFLAWAERVGSLWGLLTSIGGVVSTAALTAWAAWATELLAPYAPFSWIASGILGGLVVTGILLSFAVIRFKWAMAAATTRWQEAIPALNPLESTFRDKRIRVSDLVPPWNLEINGKTFIDCDLVGPVNLVLNGTHLTNVKFVSCDFVLVRPDALARNGVAFVDCSVLRGTIYKATFYAPPALARLLDQTMPGLHWLTAPPPSGSGD